MAPTKPRGRPRKVNLEELKHMPTEAFEDLVEDLIPVPEQWSPRKDRMWQLAAEMLKSKAKDHTNLSAMAITELANYAKLLHDEIYGPASRD